MVAVQDITADLKGNLEFVDRHTTIDRPYYEGPGGMLVSVVDILPTELGQLQAYIHVARLTSQSCRCIRALFERDHALHPAYHFPSD